jgi:DNA-binding CsgD family transcriptional regulator
MTDSDLVAKKLAFIETCLRELETLARREIAYTLGLAPSTVSSHLRSGMRRAGVRDIAALANIFSFTSTEVEAS